MRKYIWVFGRAVFVWFNGMKIKKDIVFACNQRFMNINA